MRGIAKGSFEVYAVGRYVPASLQEHAPRHGETMRRTRIGAI